MTKKPEKRYDRALQKPVHRECNQNKENVMINCHKMDTQTQVFFYEQQFYVLSNFSAFCLDWDGKRFMTSEAAYHYEKFNAHPEIQQEILEAPSAHESLQIARRNHDKIRPDWEQIKTQVMRGIISQKAAQHEYVRRQLLLTGDRELIEDSWRDGFWGWGPDKDGMNILGRLWMDVREEIRRSL